MFGHAPSGQQVWNPARMNMWLRVSKQTEKMLTPDHILFRRCRLSKSYLHLLGLFPLRGGLPFLACGWTICGLYNLNHLCLVSPVLWWSGDGASGSTIVLLQVF